MFLASKTVETGIVFALLISGMFVASPTSVAAGSELRQEPVAVVHENDVKRMQQVLYDRGHYRGKVDGIIGLRTRASIRTFQKTENLPITGRLDQQTARKLGIRPESIRSNSNGARQDIVGGQEQPGDQATRSKPWGGTRLSKGTGRTRKTLPRIVPTGADPEGGQGNREEGLRAENQKQPR
jgi:peptidoglycan hydrolase-like protein with peptidoglycan-binding domain